MDSNTGGSPLKVAIVRAHLNLPYDHRINVQNFTAQVDPSISFLLLKWYSCQA